MTKATWRPFSRRISVCHTDSRAPVLAGFVSPITRSPNGAALFNAGARRAELTAAESRFNQARLRYEQTVLEALQETSNALNQFHKAGETLEAELALQKATSEYLALATKRYRNGVLAYIDVLDAQRQLFDAQIAVSRAREVQLFALVDLYKALGGGWQPEDLAALKEEQ